MLITTNLNSYTLLRNFNNANNVVSNTIKRLSSGVRVIGASTDSASLAISAKMASTINSIDQSLKNIQSGVSLLQVADGAYQSVQGLLQKARKLAIQSGNETYTSGERQTIQNEFWSAIQEINDIANKVEYNSKKIFGDPQYAYFQRPTTSLNIASLYQTSETFTTPNPTTYTRGTVANLTRGSTDLFQIGETEYESITDFGISESFSPVLTNDNLYNNLSITDTTNSLGQNIADFDISIEGADQDIGNTLNTIYFEDASTAGWGKQYSQNWNVGDVLNVEAAGFAANSVIVTDTTTGAILSEWNGTVGDYQVNYATGDITIKDTTFINNGDNLRVEYRKTGEDVLTTTNNFDADSVVVEMSTDGGTVWNTLTSGVDYNALVTNTNSIQLTSYPSGNISQTGASAFQYKVSYVKYGTNEITLTNNPEEYDNSINIKIGATVYDKADIGTGAYGTGTWKYDNINNKIIIDPDLLDDADTSLQIRYVKTGSNDDIVTLPVGNYIEDGLSIKVDGTRITDETTFQVDGGDNIDLLTTGRLTIKSSDFTMTPAKRTVSIDYFKDAADYKIGLTGTALDFDSGDNTVLNSEVVKVNSAIKTFNTDYTIETDDTVNLWDGINNNVVYAGDKLDIDYLDDTQFAHKTTAAAGVGEIFYNTDINKVQVNANLTFLKDSLEVPGYNLTTDYVLDGVVGDTATGIVFNNNVLKGSISDIQLKYLTSGQSEINLSYTPLDYTNAIADPLGESKDSEIVKIKKKGDLVYTTLTSGVDYKYTAAKKIELLGANLLTSVDDEVVISYMRDGTDTYKGHDKEWGVATVDDDGNLTVDDVAEKGWAGSDDTLNENKFILNNLDGDIMAGSLKVNVKREASDAYTLQTEGVNFTTTDPAGAQVPPNAYIEFAADNTNGLYGSYNQIKIEYLDSGNNNTMTLSTDPLDYDGDDTNGVVDSAMVYIDSDADGAYKDGVDTKLTATADYTFAVGNNKQINFTAAGLTKIGNFGNPQIGVDYALKTDVNGDAATKINLEDTAGVNSLNAQFGDVMSGTEKIYIDKNYDGVFDATTDELLTEGAGNDYTIDYVNNTITLNDNVLIGNPNIMVEFVQDAKAVGLGGLGYDENTIQLSSTPLSYAGALNLWLDGNQLVKDTDYTVDYINNQVTLIGPSALKYGYENALANDGADDISHSVIVSYIDNNTFEFAKLADLSTINAIGATSGFPGVVWDADSVAYPAYSISVEVNDGSGWNVVNRDVANGWTLTQTQTEQTKDWNNPLTGNNYRSNINLYKNEIDLSGTAQLQTSKTSANQVKITYTYDFFEESTVPTAPANSKIQNLQVTYNDTVTGSTVLTEDSNNGWELITDTLGYDAFGIPEQIHYLSFHGEKGALNNTLNPPQVSLDYEYYSEEDRTPFSVTIHTGPLRDDTKTITLDPISVYGLGLADLSVSTPELAESTISKIDDVIQYISNAEAKVGANMSSLIKKSDRLLHYKDNMEFSTAQMIAADYARETEKMMMGKMQLMKNAMLSNKYKSQPISLAKMIYSNVKGISLF